jgi:hypothetical protein
MPEAERIQQMFARVARNIGARRGFLAMALLLAPGDAGLRLVEAARKQVGVTLAYDAQYCSINYPSGDIPVDRGCCTEVVIRAYRTLGTDLQRLVHEDIRRAPEAYHGLLTRGKADTNIDHRRVAPLWIFLQRHGKVLAVSEDPKDYLPGDIVVWRLRSGRLHIGIVAATAIDGRPLVLHNICMGVREEDVLFAYKVIGHIRYQP